MFLQPYGEKWVEVEGVRTRYFEAGEGETLVLVHGGQFGDDSGGANAEDFDRNFSALASRFRVISVDRLGQGYTDNPPEGVEWSMASVCRHFAGFLRAIGGGPFHLIGHSRGGYVVCRTTLDHPDLVTSCVMIDSSTGAPGRGRNEIVFATNPHKPGTPEASRWVYSHYSWGDEHITDEWVAMKQKICESPRNQEAIRRMKGDGLLHTVFLPGLRSDQEAMFLRLSEEQIRRPTLLFWGWNDPTAPLEQAWSLMELLSRHQPRVSLHLVNEAGHHSFRERPEVFNRVIAEFVEGVGHGD